MYTAGFILIFLIGCVIGFAVHEKETLENLKKKYFSKRCEFKRHDYVPTGTGKTVNGEEFVRLQCKHCGKKSNGYFTRTVNHMDGFSYDEVKVTLLNNEFLKR